MAERVVAMFPDLDHAEFAVADLLRVGTPRECISVVSREADRARRGEAPVSPTTPEAQRRGRAARGAGSGALLGGVTGALVAIGVFFVPGGWIIGGPIASILGAGGVGAALGAASGGIGAALDSMGIPAEPARRYAEALRRGATLVVVDADDQDAKGVAHLLDQHRPIDLDRSERRWRTEGWSGFDREVAPYGPVETAKERAAWRHEGATPRGMPIHQTEWVAPYDERPASPPIVDEGAAVGAEPAVPEGRRVHRFPIERPTTSRP